jgi:ferric-dicitrate binding protein FerR (iron transport regulator)
LAGYLLIEQCHSIPQGNTVCPIAVYASYARRARQCNEAWTQESMSTQVDRQARALLSRIRDNPNLTPEERDAAVAWLREPGNEERLLEIQDREPPLPPKAQAVLNRLRRRAHAQSKGSITWLPPSVPGLPSAADSLLSRPWREMEIRVSWRPVINMGVAAAIAVLAIGVGALHFIKAGGVRAVPVFSTTASKEKCETYRTDVGKQRSLSLADGSRSLLDADSSLEVCITAVKRRLGLEYGAARFFVAADKARPFVVTTHDIVAEAMGTVFDVYRVRGQQSRVSVLEGVVKVSALARAPQAHFKVSAGTQAMMTRGGAIQLRTGEEYFRSLEWAKHRVTFRGESMGEVLVELNRYSPSHIYIADPRVERRRLRGSIPTDDPQKILKMLELQEHIRTERDANGGTALHWED